VSGTVAQAAGAFAVDLGRYESPEESYRGREGPIYLPNDVADVVHGIFGLDNRRMARH
jgi:kumamolisin